MSAIIVLAAILVRQLITAHTKTSLLMSTENNNFDFELDLIFSGQKNHDDDEIRKAQLFIENNVGDKIIVEKLSSKFSIDRRNFDRRFKKATGNSPLEYMQRVKIEAAKKSLETSRKTVTEVMFQVGYSDVRAFREVFKKITGMSPIEYRSKYNKEAADLSL